MLEAENPDSEKDEPHRKSRKSDRTDGQRAGNYDADDGQHEDAFDDVLLLAHAFTPPNGFVAVMREM